MLADAYGQVLPSTGQIYLSGAGMKCYRKILSNEKKKNLDRRGNMKEKDKPGEPLIYMHTGWELRLEFAGVMFCENCHFVIILNLMVASLSL